MNLYTVTSADRMESIMNSGLSPEFGGSRFSHSFYGNYSRGKVFLSDADGVEYWHGKVSDMIDYSYDNTIMHFPVVLKIKSDNINLTKDDIGSKDSSSDAFFTEESIPPEEISWWNGDSWVSLYEWDIEDVIRDKKIVDYEIDEDFSDDEEYSTDDEFSDNYEYYSDDEFSNISFVEYPFNVNLSESIKKIIKITESSLTDLPDSDRKKAQSMYDQMNKMQNLSIEAYESGDYEKAEYFDSEYEKIAFFLESFLEHATEDFEHDGKEPEDYRSYDFASLETEIASSYADFKTKGIHFIDEDSFVGHLRSMLEEYSIYLDLDNFEKFTDQEIIELAKEIYDKKVKFKKARGF